MRKFLKFFLWSLLSIIVLLGIMMSVFIYKVKYGFPVSYETEAPSINFPTDQRTVLLFSKSTGFRHEESIETGKKIFDGLAKKNNWFLYSTEDGGVFNADQLSKFDVVIFNNSTGRLLNEDQQKILQAYVENGGSLMGIHGAGDDSHHWEWYEQNLVGSIFSHHTLNPQFQETEISLNEVPDSLMAAGLPAKWAHADEWYVFPENPRAKGFTILYTIDGDKINPDGNLLWTRDKNFGMGKDHPVAWYRRTGKGKTFYTSIGHDASAWKQQAFVHMLENAVNFN
jgi:type 1 glutamine amidotransferase